MQGAPQLGGAEQLRHGRRRKRPVARKSQRHGVDGRSQFRPTEDGILRSVDFLRQDDVRGPAPGEIGRIHPEPAVRRRRVREVEPHIARDQIGAPVVVQVRGGEAVPPAAQGWQAHCGRDIAQVRAVIVIELEWHPLPGGDQIHPPVAIEVDPDRGGDHPPGPDEVWRKLLGDVGEMAAVVSEEIAARRVRVIPWREAPAHE